MSKIIEKIDDIEIEFKLRENNELWLNATKACKDNKLDLSNFWKSPETQRYVKALFKKVTVDSTVAPIDGLQLVSNTKKKISYKQMEEHFKQAIRGQGTYIHPKLKVKFARWVSVDFEIACDEAVDSIIKNGYYITDEAKANPSKELIKEAKGILDSRLGIDNLRDELIDYIEEYLTDEEWNPHSLPNALSNTYQHIHIATRGMIASQILEEEITKSKGKELEITNYRQKRKMPTIYSSDYLIAQNYYTNKEVESFNKRLNFILQRVKTHIEFRPNKLSPQSVLALIKKASRDMVHETSNEIEGTTYQGKNAKQLREALKGYIKGSLEYESAMVLIDEIADGKKFILGKS